MNNMAQMISAQQKCPECGAEMYFDKGDSHNEPFWECPKGHGTFAREKLIAKGKGWYGDTPGHKEAALKAQAKEARNTPMKKEQQPKDIWLSIRSNEMMRDTLKALIQEIKSHNIQYTSYSSPSGDRLYLQLKDCPESFNKELGNWIYYQPVTQMKKPPNISDYDVTDW